MAAGEEDTSERLEKVELPEEYYSSAGDAAKQRVVEAGFRLAGVLKSLVW